MIKKIRNILVLFLFLQLLFFSIQNFKSVRPKFNLNSEFSFELINLNEVKEFEIRDKSGSVKFDKRGQNWFFKANGERAYSDKIETKLAEIKSLENLKDNSEEQKKHYKEILDIFHAYEFASETLGLFIDNYDCLVKHKETNTSGDKKIAKFII